MENPVDMVPVNPRAFAYGKLKEEEPPVLVVGPGPFAAPLRHHQPVPDHLAWSLFSLSYLNVCCLGFIATVYSVKSRDRKVVGDIEGAQHYGSTARSFNIAATVLSILIIIMIIALAATGLLHLMR